MEERNNRNREIYQEYLNSCIARNGATRNTTYKTYAHSMKLFLEYLKEFENNCYMLDKKTIQNIVPILEKYIRYCREKRNNNAQTINNKLVAISSFYIWAVKRCLIVTHPFRERLDRLKVTDVEKRRKSYYLSQRQIIEADIKMETNKNFDIQDRIIFNLIIDTGCRINALQSIKIENLNLIDGIISGVIEKEQKLVEFPIFEETIELVKNWIEIRNEKQIKEDYLLVTKYKGIYKQMTKSTIRERVKKIGKLIGIERLYPHSIRKTAINLLANASNLEIASEFANHSGVDVTRKHYIKEKSGIEKRNKILEMRKKIGI